MMHDYDPFEVWAAQKRERLGGPPTPEEVVAFLRGELNEKEAARVQALLVYYPELTPLLRERKRVVPRKRRIWTRALPVAAAAVIALQTILLVQSRMQLAGARRPHVHEARHELESAPLIRGFGGTPVPELPAGESEYLIALTLTGRPNTRNYRLDLLDLSAPRKRVVWSASSVRPNERTFNLTIPGTYLRPGSYTIDVYAAAEGGVYLLERFPFDVKNE